MYNIVIIDDNEYKMRDSIEALSNIYEDVTFYKFESRNKALLFLEKYNSIVDLLILDWNFPIFDGAMSEIGMGKSTLNYLRKKEISINTIICSSEEVLLDEEYENVIGKIIYNPTKSLTENYRDILEYDDINNEMYYGIHWPKADSYKVGVMYTPENNESCEDLWNGYSYEQLKKEQKQLTKYKRKRSSDPWWKKN